MRSALRAAVAAGVAGNIAISIYLSIALPLFFHTPPLLLFQWDDSNIAGDAAYRGGWGSATLGFLFDFIVAIAWAAAFTAAYAYVPAIRRYTAACGLLFGVVVMLAMFYVVVPLGHAQHPSSDLRALLSAFAAHTLFFGLPVALVVRRLLSDRVVAQVGAR